MVVDMVLSSKGCGGGCGFEEEKLMVVDMGLERKR